MNYRINNITKPIECETQILPEFPALLGGTTPDHVSVFDASKYCESEGFEDCSAAVFGKINRIYIQRLIDSGNLNASSIFYITQEGHLLINQSLMYIFLMTINPAVFEYFFSLINDAMRSGMAFSDTYLIGLIQAKVPSEYLHQILEARK